MGNTTDQTMQTQQATTKEPARLNTKKRKVLTPDTLVRCYNNTPGRLFYESKRIQGYSEQWDEAGEYADIELAELRSMARTQPAFFKNNWLRIDDWEVLVDLRMDRYYKNAFYVQDVDKLFTLRADELKQKLESLNVNARSFVIYLARTKIESGELDSMSVINTIESVYNCDLIERD